jgi:PAS domain S-box-containing protein
MQENLRAMMAQEVALRKSAQSQLADALENSSDGVILLDADERILTVNGQVLSLFPLIAHQFMPGSSFREALAEARRRGLYERFSYNEADEIEETETETAPPRAIRVADGRWLKVNRSAARNGGGSVVIWTDITELKLREEHLQAAKEEAEKASEAKTKFLATISHELRTPLNAIIGFSELIATEALGKAGIKQYVEYAVDIQSSGSHLLGIINDILDIAHSEAGTLSLRPEPMNVAAVIETCRRLVQHQCEAAGHSLAIEIGQDLPEIEADSGRVRQILLNLVSNAIKFTPEGGRISVRASPARDGGVDIAVADTGIGMKPEDLAVALEPFRQIDNALSRKYQGTGLGLPLTKSLVELHAGTFHIESKPGSGTTITVHLPPRPGIAAEAAHERRYGAAC